MDIREKGVFRRNLFEEAQSNGYLVTDRNGKAFLIPNTTFSAGLIDLSNPDAKIWIKKVIKDELIGNGAKGWMADFGEALPYDAVLHSGELASVFHNKYPEEWAKVNREVIEETGNDSDFVFFTRSGFRKSPKYSTLFWLGDQMVNWDENDGIKTAVTGLLSSGVSGYSLNHSDIGGYTTIKFPIMRNIRSKELLLRWMELNAFTAVFRTHEGNLPDENAQCYSDGETIKHFSYFARLYQALAPYRQNLMNESLNTGMPLVRHLFLHYPNDPNTYLINYQEFMLGPDIIVAPVLDPGKQVVKVYLPPGMWTHLWSNKTYVSDVGQYVNVAAPLGRPGVFIRPESLPDTLLNQFKSSDTTSIVKSNQTQSN